MWFFYSVGVLEGDISLILSVIGIQGDKKLLIRGRKFALASTESQEKCLCLNGLVQALILLLVAIATTGLPLLLRYLRLGKPSQHLYLIYVSNPKTPTPHEWLSSFWWGENAFRLYHRSCFLSSFWAHPSVDSMILRI